MLNLVVRRWLQTLKHGWINSGRVCAEVSPRRNILLRMKIFGDIFACFRKYYLFSNQYFENKFWAMDPQRKVDAASRIGLDNWEHDQRVMRWSKGYLANWKFLNEFTQMKYEMSVVLQNRRNEAYRRRYNMGEDCWVQYGVTIIAEHMALDSHVTMGDRVLLARECDLDITGNLTIGNDVKIMEGTKIFTHAHDMLNWKREESLIPGSNRAYKTDLTIGDNVQICARAIIMPGVSEIGANSMISAGAVVTRKVPPHCIVAGNPAKVVAEIPPEVVLHA